MLFTNIQVVYYNLSLVPQSRNDVYVKPGDRDSQSEEEKHVSR